jgi:hypothetical protein
VLRLWWCWLVPVDALAPLEAYAAEAVDDVELLW